MELKFSSIEEVQEFVKRLKGTRGGKAGADETETAPAPLAPPTTPAPASQGFNPGGFAPPAAGAAPQAVAFPAPAAPAVAPEVQGLVGRIVTKLDGAIASGQPADQVLGWFRSQCGAEAANADLAQIKTVFLPKLTVPALENIAKLMNA